MCFYGQNSCLNKDSQKNYQFYKILVSSFRYLYLITVAIATVLTLTWFFILDQKSKFDRKSYSRLSFLFSINFDRKSSSSLSFFIFDQNRKSATRMSFFSTLIIFDQKLKFDRKSCTHLSFLFSISFDRKSGS